MSTDLNSTTLDRFSFEENDSSKTNGFLNIGEKINGYVITERMNTDSGESEIYFCEKNQKTYILKYYFSYSMISVLQDKIKSIKDENVLTVCDTGTYKKHFYEVDEFCSGGSLDKYLPFSEEEAFSIISQINNGLKAIHAAGIIHRDIKAENIYFKDETKKQIVIGDFGICTLYDQKDNVNEHLTKIDAGTDGYKAPETFNGVISPAIDYYSLGITVWNLLTGKDPFYDEDGEALSSGEIRLKTIEGTVCDYLLNSTTNLSTKSRTLISGLLVYRHDQRWRFEEVEKYLAGKEVLVFEEKRELDSKFFFDGDELSSLKSIAEKLLEKKDKAIEMLKGTDLIRCLDRNGFGDKAKGALTDKVEKIIEEFIVDNLNSVSSSSILGGFENSQQMKEYGIVKIAFTLCKELPYNISYNKQIFSILSLRDFTELLKNHPIIITEYLLKEYKGLYVKLQTLVDKNETSDSDFSDFVSKIKTFVKNSKNTRTLCATLFLSLTDNKLKPFNDKFSQNIELREPQDVENLDEHLKRRLMYLVNEKNLMVIAWFESVYHCKMDDWYDELEGGKSKDKEIAGLRRNKLAIFGQWEYFELFLKNQDVITRQYFSENGKFGLKNLDGSVLLSPFFDDVGTVFIRDRFIVKTGNTWHVCKFEAGNFTSLLNSENEYTGELFVFDERKFTYFEQKESSYKIIGEKIEDSEEKKGELQILSEIGKPLSRFICKKENNYDLLDENFNVLCTSENIASIPYEKKISKELSFWIINESRVKKITRDCKIIESFDYSYFKRIDNTSFEVKNLDGIYNVVTENNELIIENIDNFKSIKNIAVIKRHHKKNWELINLKDNNWTYSNKKYRFASFFGNALLVFNSKRTYYFFHEVNSQFILTKVKKSGLISNSLGFRKKFKALNLDTIQKSLKPNEDDFYNNIVGFNGEKFEIYSFNDGKTYEINSPQFIANNEMLDLISNVKSKEIIQRIQYLSNKNEYSEMNGLINCSALYYCQLGMYEDARRIFEFARMDKTEELDLSISEIKNYIGATYFDETPKRKKDYTVKYKSKNVSLGFCYCLSAVGKEINREGKIIDAPYFEKIKSQWNLLAALNSLEKIILFANNYLTSYVRKYLKNNWEKEYIISIAQETLKALYNSVVDEDCINQYTYQYLNKIGACYETMNNHFEALKVYEMGISYEPEFSVLNIYDAFRLNYSCSNFKRAAEFGEIIKKRYPNINKDASFMSTLNDCKKRLGL